MFTGLIDDVGRIGDVTAVEAGQRLRIHAPFAALLGDGESVAVNGVCLTVATRDDVSWSADVSPETLRVTALGRLAAGFRVNLERSLAVGSRLGGHFVQGHVDGTGELTAVRQEGQFWRLTVSFPPALAPYFIEKGSVAVDGVSLTVAALGPSSFDVQIIPHTWTHTTLQDLRPGHLVNLECDMVGKYVLRGLSLGLVRP